MKRALLLWSVIFHIMALTDYWLYVALVKMFFLVIVPVFVYWFLFLWAIGGNELIMDFWGELRKRFWGTR